MLTQIHPKLPMRNKQATRDFYCGILEFTELGDVDFPHYFMCEKDGIEIHFFEYKELDPLENYGQVYIRTDAINGLHQYIQSKGIKISPLELKPWMQKEFSIIDPDHNLLTFGESIL